MTRRGISRCDHRLQAATKKLPNATVGVKLREMRYSTFLQNSSIWSKPSICKWEPCQWSLFGDPDNGGLSHLEASQDQCLLTGAVQRKRQRSGWKTWPNDCFWNPCRSDVASIGYCIDLSLQCVGLRGPYRIKRRTRRKDVGHYGSTLCFHFLLLYMLVGW